MNIPHSVSDAEGMIDTLPRDANNQIIFPITPPIPFKSTILPDNAMQQAEQDAYVLWGYALGQTYDWTNCPNPSHWWDLVYRAGVTPNAPITNAQDLGASFSALLHAANLWLAPQGAVTNSGDIKAGDTVIVQVTSGANFPIQVTDSGTGAHLTVAEIGGTVSFVAPTAGAFTITLTDNVDSTLTTKIAYVVKAGGTGNAPTADIKNGAPIYEGSIVVVEVTASDNTPVYVIDNRSGNKQTITTVPGTASIQYWVSGIYNITVQDSVNLLSKVLEVTIVPPSGAPPVFTVTNTDLTATCTITSASQFPCTVSWGDGSNPDTVAAAGGSKTHTYTSADTYTVTVTSNNGLSAQKQVTVTAPVAPDITVVQKADLTATITVVSAENFPVSVDWGDSSGTGTIATAGGTRDYTYATANTYTVKATDASNGQSTSKQVTVTAAVAPVFTVTAKSGLTAEVVITSAENFPVTVDWGDESATVTISQAGGTKDYTYASANTYTVKVSDASNGTSATHDVTVAAVVQTAAPVAPDFSIAARGSLQAAVRVNSAANFPVSVDWGDGLSKDSIAAAGSTKQHTYSTAQKYTVTVTDASNGGVTNKDVTVT